MNSRTEIYRNIVVCKRKPEKDKNIIEINLTGLSSLFSRAESYGDKQIKRQTDKEVLRLAEQDKERLKHTEYYSRSDWESQFEIYRAGQRRIETYRIRQRGIETYRIGQRGIETYRIGQRDILRLLPICHSCLVCSQEHVSSIISHGPC